MTLPALIAEPIFQGFLLFVAAIYAVAAWVSHPGKTSTNIASSLFFVILFLGCMFLSNQ